jgi:hypothetical protein
MKISLLFFSFLAIILSLNLQANEELVLNNDHQFQPTFSNRYTFSLGLNPSIQKSTDIRNFAFNYASKKYENSWLDFNLIIGQGFFKKMTTNNPSATQLSNLQLEDNTSKHTTFGIGPAFETRYIQTLIPLSDIYELIATNLTYNILQEPTSNYSFKGPGLLAKFSVYKRFSDYISAGTQFTYNLAVVKRAQLFDTESSSARSLTLSYLTIGFDLSFYL